LQLFSRGNEVVTGVRTFPREPIGRFISRLKTFVYRKVKSPSIS
jgi:hypothetical protein